MDFVYIFHVFNQQMYEYSQIKCYSYNILHTVSIKRKGTVVFVILLIVIVIAMGLEVFYTSESGFLRPLHTF